jgi:hypothetical protein
MLINDKPVRVVDFAGEVGVVTDRFEGTCKVKIPGLEAVNATVKLVADCDQLTLHEGSQ